MACALGFFLSGMENYGYCLDMVGFVIDFYLNLLMPVALLTIFDAIAWAFVLPCSEKEPEVHSLASFIPAVFSRPSDPTFLQTAQHSPVLSILS